MTVRTTHSVVAFGNPFALAGFDGPLPAGSYRLMVEEEPFEAAGHVGYRRVAATLRIETAGRVEHHPVTVAALDEALQRDREMAARTIDQRPGAEIVSAEPFAEAGRPGRFSIARWLRSARARFRG